MDTGEIEVGYLIVRKSWGMNYASEALKGLLNWSKKILKQILLLFLLP
nr:GNAT family N-acetyltransferase [Legionella rowbothamii]